MNVQEFSVLIQKLRLQRGWSQEQLAELSGLSVRTIQRIETGQKPSTESLKSLAAVFETDFSTLLTEPDMTTATPTAANFPAAPASLASSAEEEEAFKHVRALRRFYGHLLRYVVVIAVLTTVNLLRSPDRLWVLYVAGFWGLGLLAHAARVFEWFGLLGPQWERRQVERRLGRKL